MRIYREQLDRGRKWLHKNAGFWRSDPDLGVGFEEYFWEDLGNHFRAEELFILDLLESMGVSVEPRAVVE